MVRIFLLLAVICSLAKAAEHKISSNELETKIFCGCTDQAYTEALGKSIATKSSLWNRLKSLLHLTKKEPCLEKKTIKCADSSQVLRIIIASIGTSKPGLCSEKTSTYESLHSGKDKTICHEVLRSTEVASKQCDKKNECSFQINDMFSNICQAFDQPKHLNIVYSCSDHKRESTDTDKSLKLKRIKRMNKFEKDNRNRDAFAMAPFIHMPYRWTYDALQPESFRNNRAMWGTGFYDYYNDYNYETIQDNIQYQDYLDRVYDEYEEYIDEYY